MGSAVIWLHDGGPLSWPWTIRGKYGPSETVVEIDDRAGLDLLEQVGDDRIVIVVADLAAATRSRPHCDLLTEIGGVAH